MTTTLTAPALPVGAVAAIGHPGGARLAVMHSDGWRYLGGARHDGSVAVEEWRAGWTVVGGPVPGVEQMLRVARADDGPPERLTDGFRAFVAVSQGDTARVRRVLDGMPAHEIAALREVAHSFAFAVDVADVRRVWEIAAGISREAQEAGLVVIELRPQDCGHEPERLVFSVVLYTGDLRLWVEARHESAAAVREHIAHYRQAQAEALG